MYNANFDVFRQIPTCSGRFRRVPGRFWKIPAGLDGVSAGSGGFRTGSGGSDRFRRIPVGSGRFRQRDWSIWKRERESRFRFWKWIWTTRTTAKPAGAYQEEFSGSGRSGRVFRRRQIWTSIPAAAADLEEFTRTSVVDLGKETNSSSRSGKEGGGARVPTAAAGVPVGFEQRQLKFR